MATYIATCCNQGLFEILWLMSGQEDYYLAELKKAIQKSLPLTVKSNQISCTGQVLSGRICLKIYLGYERRFLVAHVNLSSFAIKLVRIFQ